MTPEEFLDGWALWQEHKPQSGDDWRNVARRSIAATDYDPSVGSPLFQALYAAEAEVIRLRGWLTAIETTASWYDDNGQRLAYEVDHCLCVEIPSMATDALDGKPATP